SSSSSDSIHTTRTVRGSTSTSGGWGSPPIPPTKCTTCSPARATSGRERATTCAWIRRTCRRTCSGSATGCAASRTSTTSSDSDGLGDVAGLTSKLDYIRYLGVNTIWLLPFYPSPLRDDGYDVADYHNVHPNYGTRNDLRLFVREAHRRGLRVITELVVNHTSDQHPWFQAARRAPPGSSKRDFYVWSDDPNRYSGTRIIFTDTESSNWAWDDVAKAYYWHRFFSHQPDLNFANPNVLKAVVRTMRFWLDMGVDGFRLDAIPYLCVREGTTNENLPETHQVIKRIRAMLDERHANRLLLAEANQWPEDVRE